MQRNVQKWLWDARDACERIAAYAQGRTFRDYLLNDMLPDAIERRLTIICEALNQAMKLMPELREQITRSSEIIGFRNILIHDYPHIVQDRVWNIVEKHLPLLLIELESLLPKPGDPTFPNENE